MRRRLPWLLSALVLALIPAALGTIVAVLYSGSGERLLGRVSGSEPSSGHRVTPMLAVTRSS